MPSLAPRQLEWLEFLGRNRRGLVRATRASCRGTADTWVEEAVDRTAARLVELFQRHPEWPEEKFPTKSALLAYAATAARYECLALTKRGAREAPADMTSLAAQDRWAAQVKQPPDVQHSDRQAAAEQLALLVGALNRRILMLRYEGEGLDSIGAILSRGQAEPVQPHEVFNRLLALQHNHPWLVDLLPPIDPQAALQHARCLLRDRHPLLDDTDLELVAGRLAGESFEAIAERLTAGGHHNARGGWFTANTLRQRMARVLKGLHGRWLHERLPPDRKAPRQPEQPPLQPWTAQVARAAST